MKGKRLTDILFTVGIVVIIAGILGGIVAGVVGGNGFNLIPAVAVWLASVIGGTGIVTISGSLSEAKSKKNDDVELLREIMNKIKNDEESH